MAKKLIVLKFGGTSVANARRRKMAAQIVLGYKNKGYKIVVVVSASGDTTDELLRLAHKINPRPCEREIDMLLSTGEQISCALMALALQRQGVDAVSFTGAQGGIITDTSHTQARIIKIETERILAQLKKNKVVVIAGFQGRTEDSEITTLGRGGSDLTAVALAKALAINYCEIYSDIEGIYTADPHIVSNASKIDVIDYDEMLEMASLGAQVMQDRSLEVAKKFNVIIHVRSIFKDLRGTIIKRREKDMEEVMVRGVSFNEKEAKITICDVPDKPGLAGRIFTALSEKGINVDMIVQNISRKRITDISFTVPKSMVQRTVKIVRAISRSIGAGAVFSNVNIGRISVVGVGMRTHPGVAAKMFEALASRRINIEMISTSDISISCIIKKDKLKEALRAIHKRFDLGTKK
ncbi:MAG: aspartate kinase [Candidatus Omnitrophica bacterium]|nr:aspartate kinase [Candidatus Omnitrophota bacterium]